MQLEPNTKLQSTATYLIEKKIGQGGFGITYKGKMQHKLAFKTIEHTICIKELFIGDSCGRSGTVLTFSNPTFKDRFQRFKKKFLREAETLAKFQEERYIVSILDVFEANNTVYIVMDFIDGQPLDKVLQQQGQLSIPIALKYIRQVGEALQAAHRQNIFHLDVKPSNIIINENDDAILIDFGIAKQLKEGNDLITNTTQAHTDGFAAIEQYIKSDKVKFSPATDVYGLGATLYKTLTQQTPEAAPSRSMLDNTPANELNSQISKTLNQTIHKALSVKPTERFQSINDFLKAFSKEKQIEHIEETVIIGEVEPDIVIPNIVTSISKNNINDFCKMVYVEGGSFMMGNEEFEVSKPLHVVTLNDFFIGKYLITQKEWEKIMKYNPSHFKGKKHPVEEISWMDIQVFLKKLNNKTGLKYRLLNEEEWEFAAKGGIKSKGFKYSGSNILQEVAWIYEDNHTKTGTSPVGYKKPNELGIFDMSGNVWEWCKDVWYPNYHRNEKDKEKDYRVVRGSSWALGSNDGIVTYRNSLHFSTRNFIYGFRLAHDA